MRSIAEIQALASRLLDLRPSPPARLRLLREVFKAGTDHAAVRALAGPLDHSRQVQILLSEQHKDGGWGAFHSRSSSARQKTASTEVAVERAVNLGLDREHPALCKAKEYILAIMRGDLCFPDYQERNDRWVTGMRLFLASTLSLIDPAHRVLEEDRAMWRAIAVLTFQSGNYSDEHEALAHRSLTGASVRGSYLVLNNRYALNVLGSQPDLLPPTVEESLLSWLWHHEQGIGYLAMPLARKPPLSRPGPLDRWLASLEMLLRRFPRSSTRISRWIDWIWTLRDEDGFWDFGPRAPSSTFLPLADNWRQRGQQRIDWSTRVLLLSALCANADPAV